MSRIIELVALIITENKEELTGAIVEHVRELVPSEHRAELNDFEDEELFDAIAEYGLISNE